MTWYVVALETDPDLYYKVFSYASTGSDSEFNVTKVFAQHINPQAIFMDRQRANEYAAYMNLKLYS